MRTPTGSKAIKLFQRAASVGGRLFWQLAKRGYAIAIIVIVLWLSWQALFYLISALMLPAKPPQQIVGIPTRLTESVVMRVEADDGGGRPPPNPRSPLSHYHRLDNGFQADQFNGCTISQCHAPLPHAKNKADRAFLNMHATSLHCSVCHAQQDQSPIPMVWYDLKSGQSRSEAPSLLQAYAWLTSPLLRETNTFTPSDQTEIVRLLRAAAQEAFEEKALVSLAEHLAAVRATSDEFARLVRVTRDAVRGHFRGEYGAKLALVDARTQKPRLAAPGSQQAVEDFLRRRSTLSDAEKVAVLAKIHPPRRNPTLHCTECHRSEKSLIDLPSLGYPPARVQAISSPLVTDAIEHMVEGKPFHLPAVLEPKE